MTARRPMQLVLALGLAFLLLPLILVVLFSFGRNPLVGFPLGGLTLDWYREVLSVPNFRSALGTALGIAALSALLATLSGTLAAMALAQMAERRARWILAALSIPALLPPLVIAIALVVLFVRGLGTGIGWPVTVLGHLLIAQPFVTLIVLSRLARFDRSALEAARDLGASRWQAFRLVMLPQIRSAIIGAGLIAIALSLDDFVIASFTLGGGNTVSTFVWGKLRTTLDPSVNAVASLLLLITAGLTLVALRLSRYRS